MIRHPYFERATVIQFSYTRFPPHHLPVGRRVDVREFPHRLWKTQPRDSPGIGEGEIGGFSRRHLRQAAPLLSIEVRRQPDLVFPPVRADGSYSGIAIKGDLEARNILRQHRSLYELAR